MKKIIILLISINMISHSMDQHILTNKDVIKELTKCLHIQNHYCTDKSGKTFKWTKPHTIIELFGKDIRSLKCTHTSFDNYYSDEKNMQGIIRNLVLNHNQKDNYVCCALSGNFDLMGNITTKEGPLYAIKEKIEKLFDIAAKPNAQFTKDDLKDSWYMNTTIDQYHGWIKEIAPKKVCIGYMFTSNDGKLIDDYKFIMAPKSKQKISLNNYDIEPFSLLTTAYKRKQLDKMRILIEHGTDATQTLNNLLLIDIAKKRAQSKKSDEDKKNYLDIAKLLLENKADPDIRTSPKYPTPLMIAVYNKDKEYTKLLLQHQADPYQIAEYPFKEKEINAFEMGKIGWLREIVDEINKK